MASILNHLALGGMVFLFYFQTMSFLNFNGKLKTAEDPVLLAANRGYRYGDGLFETLKVQQGRLLLSRFHFERLWEGLAVLKYEIPVHFTPARLENEILQLCTKNKIEHTARIRLSVYRGNGGLYDDDRALSYIIECWPLNPVFDQLNENGLVIDVFPDARKSCDRFANLKSSGFLPYAMAAVYAKEKKLNDCLVLNTAGHIADTTIANVFIIKDHIIKTPALSEACVAGVMRRYLLESFSAAGYTVEETILGLDDLRQADEVFLSNAIRGIRWVKQFEDRTYTSKMTIELFDRFVKTIQA